MVFPIFLGGVLDNTTFPQVTIWTGLKQLKENTKIINNANVRVGMCHMIHSKRHQAFGDFGHGGPNAQQPKNSWWFKTFPKKINWDSLERKRVGAK